MLAARDPLADVSVPFTVVILAANDWLLSVMVDDILVTRPAKEDDNVLAVVSVVVILDANDWLLLVAADSTVVNRPAIELLLLVTATLVSETRLANEELSVVRSEATVVILAEKEDESLDWALYTSVTYAAADDELADTVKLTADRLEENEAEFATMLAANEPDAVVSLDDTAAFAAAALAELALIESVNAVRLPVIDPEPTVILSLRRAND